MFDVKMPKSEQNGLKTDSLARVDKIAALQQTSVLCRIGTLESKLLAEVDLTLKRLFEL